MTTLIKQYIDKYGDIDVEAMKAIAFTHEFVDNYMRLKKITIWLKYEKENK